MSRKNTGLDVGGGLADDVDDTAEDASAWARRFRKKKKEGKLPANKADEYDALDDEGTAKGQELMAAGLTVGHAMDDMATGAEYILTLKDTGRLLNSKGELAEEEEDVLEDQDLVLDQKQAFNKKIAKKFNKYDAEEDDGPLRKYDDDYMEFDKTRKSFKLNAQGEADAVMEETAPDGTEKYSLDTGVGTGVGFAWNKEQRNTFTEEEMKAFRKPKKKKLIRKKTAAEVQQLQQELEREKAEEEGRMAVTRTQRRAEAEETTDALDRLAAREAASRRVEQNKRTADEELNNISKATASASAAAAGGGGVEGFELTADTRNAAEADDEGIVLDPLTQFTEAVQVTAQSAVSSARAAREKAAQGVAAEPEEVSAEREKARNDLVKDIDIVSQRSTTSVAGAMAALQQTGLAEEARVGRANDAVLEGLDDGGFQFGVRRDAQGRLLTQKEAFREEARRLHGKTSSTKRQGMRERQYGQLQAQTRMGQTDTALGGMAGLMRAQQKTGQAGIVVSAGMNKVAFDVAAGQKRGAPEAGAGDKRRKT